GEAFLPHFATNAFDAVEIGDRGLVVGWMVDPPSRAVRPVNPDAIAAYCAERCIAGVAQARRPGIAQRVLDGTERARAHAARCGPGDGIAFLVDALVVVGVLADDAGRKALERSAEAGCAEAFVEFAPADDAGVGRHLDEVVVSPASIAGECF